MQPKLKPRPSRPKRTALNPRAFPADTCHVAPPRTESTRPQPVGRRRETDAPVSKGMNEEKSRIVTPQIFCRSCASPLVQSTDWQRADESRWSVRLWCPECGFEQPALLDRPQVTYLSLAIEEGFACMLEALAELDTVVPAHASLDLVKRARSDRIEPAGR